MSFGTIVFIAFALAMDAFAVSLAFGVMARGKSLKKILQLPLMFGAFQMIMPLVGWGAGTSCYSFISRIDHWVAFVLLSAVGLKMIGEARKSNDRETAFEGTWLSLLGLSVATSLDALAVGISFAFLNVPIVLAIAIIGGVTFFLSLGGILLGSRLKSVWQKKAEFLGGLLLVAMGVRILVSHLFFDGKM